MYFKCPKYSRITFVMYHLSFSLLTIFGAMSGKDSILYTVVPTSTQIYNESIVFCKVLTLYQYCEFYWCLLFHFPFYITMTYLLSREGSINMEEVKADPILNFT
jgi:hypothetical protein